MKWKDIVPWRGGQRRVSLHRRRDPFSKLQEEMNKLFEGVTGSSLEHILQAGKLSGSFCPTVDVKEGEEAIRVFVEVPGMASDEIEVELHPDELVIRGERKQEEEEREEGGVHYRESTFGAFERAVPLHCSINEEQVYSELKRGVLMIYLPKASSLEKGSRKVAINELQNN